MNQPLNRYGICPNPECKTDWDAGDILDNLKRVSALSMKSEEDLVNIAFKSFGYNKLNPKHFSKVIAITVISDDSRLTEPHFYMCPKCRCVWDADTSQEYTSLLAGKKLKFHEPDNQQLLEQAEI